MALIQCPECSKEVSDKAVACPFCGCPISPTESKKNFSFESVNEIVKALIARVKALPKQQVIILASVAILLIAFLCIPSGVKRDKALLKDNLLEPSSLTIYEAYTSNDFIDGSRATLFYFGAKNKAGGISDDWALVYDGTVQFESTYKKAKNSGDNKGILAHQELVMAQFSLNTNGEKWRKVNIN